jgi:hypothetical protein
MTKNLKEQKSIILNEVSAFKMLHVTIPIGLKSILLGFEIGLAEEGLNITTDI